MKLAGGLGVAMILATNLVSLLGVGANRSGELESSLVLSERELWPERGMWADDENSGVALRLVWRVASSQTNPLIPDFGGDRHDPVGWLNAEKLAELGFDVSLPPVSEDGGALYNRQLPREVVLVLELDGPAYREALDRARRNAQHAERELASRPGDRELAKRAEWARERLSEEESVNSRLFVIDAGLDREALRARHPDRTRLALVHGQIRTYVEGRELERQFRGYVAGLSIESIHVDLSHRAALEPLLLEARSVRKPSEQSAAITVDFGQRLEPWITGLVLSKRAESDALQRMGTQRDRTRSR